MSFIFAKKYFDRAAMPPKRAKKLDARVNKRLEKLTDGLEEAITVAQARGRQRLTMKVRELDLCDPENLDGWKRLNEICARKDVKLNVYGALTGSSSIVPSPDLIRLAKDRSVRRSIIEVDTNKHYSESQESIFSRSVTVQGFARYGLA